LGSLAAAAACIGFALGAIVGPGLAAQRALRLRVDPALAIPLGLLQAAAFQWLAVTLGRPWLFAVLALLADASLLLRRGPWLRAPGPTLRGSLPSFVAVAILVVATRYGVNRTTPEGDFLLDGLSEDDTAFHVGLTWEATLGLPAEVPGLAGVTLHYHMGSALVRAAAVWLTLVPPYDLLTRCQPLLYGLALILALRAAAHAIGASSLVVQIVPWTLLAGDFAFLFAFDRSVHYWTDYLRGNLLMAIVLGNDMVAALAMVLASLAALARHEAGEDGRWLWLAGLLALGLPFFKVFVAAHYLLGLGVGLVLTRRRLPLLAIAAPLLAGTLALTLQGGTDTVITTFDPLVPLGAVPQWLSGLPSAFRAAAWTVLWLLASLGLRLAGLPEALRALRSGRPPAVVLAGLALSGWVVGLLVRLSPRDLMPSQKVFNEASCFIEQSGPLLWIFTAMALAAWSASVRRRALALAACAALAAPTTVQFVARKRQRPARVQPAALLQAMSVLARVTRPGEVVLQRPDPRFPPPPLVFIGRRVPYTRTLPYMTQFATRPALEERLATVKSFFRTDDPEQARRVAGRLGARYLCLYGDDRVAFDPRGVLLPLYETPDARVYYILR
jgi:hypothetical protein